MNNHRNNWAGNYEYQAPKIYESATVEEFQEIVAQAKKVKALGSRHCFNDIADCSETQISTKNLSKLIEIDKNAMTVTIEGGSQYGQFCSELHEKGFALHNLASLPHISVVGACATATHGSGVKNGNLATSVLEIEFISGTGDLVTLSREKDGEKFKGAVVNLGALGVVTRLTLDLEKSFQVRQDCFQNLPLSDLSDNFEEIMSAGYSVSLFTNWQEPIINQIWIKSRLDREFNEFGNQFYGANKCTENLHPIAGISAENCTEQLGIAGAWCDRLPHFKMGFTPSVGAELQSEYFVAKENAVEAIFELDKLRDLISPLLLVSEIRTIAADKFWLSPCYKQDSVAFHFTWVQKTDEVMKLLPLIEKNLSKFKAKPHWGKLFTMPKEKIHSLYEKIPDFIGLMQEFDPNGKFRNEYLERNIY
ncbi:MAG TPA: D-arabinono-1,4-lactone oxidase [Pyrinomonadaceae bacterium]|nr:D-arabinono-1,4-lactone oxidase [Pyrinomonadaceae bacterium]